MKKAELIKVLVPATIQQWKDNTPQHIHDGKEREIEKLFWQMNKTRLMDRYECLVEKGYIQ